MILNFISSGGRALVVVVVGAEVMVVGAVVMVAMVDVRRYAFLVSS